MRRKREREGRERERERERERAQRAARSSSDRDRRLAHYWKWPCVGNAGAQMGRMEYSKLNPNWLPTEIIEERGRCLQVIRDIHAKRRAADTEN